jgi:hypothetical protein
MFQYHVSVAFGTGGDIKEFGVARLRLQLTSTSRKGLQIGCPQGDFWGKRQWFVHTLQLFHLLVERMAKEYSWGLTSSQHGIPGWLGLFS